MGFGPTRHFGQQGLSLSRLPVPPSAHKKALMGSAAPIFLDTAASLNRMFLPLYTGKTDTKICREISTPRLHGERGQTYNQKVLPRLRFGIERTNQHQDPNPHFILLLFYLLIVNLLGRRWQQPDNLILPAVGIEPTSAPYLGAVLPLIRSPHITAGGCQAFR